MRRPALAAAWTATRSALGQVTSDATASTSSSSAPTSTGLAWLLTRAVGRRSVASSSTIAAAAGTSPPPPPGAAAAAPRMPAEYERYYAGKLPTPSARAVEAAEAAAAARRAATAAATATTSSAAAADDAAANAQAGAAAATAWMFPWERRQLDGAPGGLKPWEKAYWGLFVGGLAFLLASRLYRGSGADAPPLETPEAAAAKAAAQAEATRALLLGRSYVGDDDDDPLEGLTPAEIQAIADKAIGAGASGRDPFDGWSPEEINAWVEANGDRVPGTA